MFGDWYNSPQDLNYYYSNAVPFEHVVIPDFFTNEWAEKIYKEIPPLDDTWWHYDNPFEQKFLKSEFTSNVINSNFQNLNSDAFVKAVEKVTGIKNLEHDPFMHSAGIHVYPRNGKIGIHLDYTIHPKSGKERRISLMIYMTKNWKPEYLGRLKLWDATLTNYKRIECSMWNTAVLFKTSEDAYHSVEPVKCPKGDFRTVLGLYYLSTPRPETAARPRYNAELFPDPGESISPHIKNLYEIRKSRRLTPEDLADWPNWREECGLNE
jgi:Rps23 Pro-64 3,4-dihydroxylase Tpa1-like proline 4-hydroxylase